ncbi:M1 family metallopeptidase [Flavivirga aquimarina]|uniref:Aminopeptidase N n=1 Tax=Flavivirga aquimarina TaxID=2027862 RepID=A0ABT8W7C3_9FLAO|nr:M1 family metallopeptidase [Flavivirga aquimarina]MDO5969019.1 M1 family metallopeptidase [Flavivirga aquimarina]
MKKITLVLGCLILLNSSCSKKQNNAIPNYIEEPHSFSQPNDAAITHLDLDINVDFDNEIIQGKASYLIKNNEASQIILDTKFITIDKVQADGKDTTFTLGDFDTQLGSPLKIDINQNTKRITVFYKTTHKTEALQWLKPRQTTDKIHPFLFTQGQAILTRTWIPIQDSPQIRITYNAKVQVPSQLMAVMSAENPKTKTPDGLYTFKMAQPISPYLIALAVGDIEYKAVSNRTGIYAEKSMVDKAHYEFSDMENMVASAEALYGTYAWEQFDVIVLPPSFPFGGMENPRLTFATPTVIAGDKSLTSLIAHELAHSWSGNLVTNASWDDFWLNEGFTVYFEMRIMEALYGKDRANMLARIGRQDLEEEIEGFKDTPDDTKLKLNLKGRNPDDGMNSIAYDKGYLFLRTLEETVGREKFDTFLKSYFQKHAFSTIHTEKFVAFLNDNLLEKHGITFNTDEWIYTAGIPDNQSIILSDKFETVEKTVQQFVKTNTVDKTLTKDWTTQEWVHFVRNFPDDIKTEHLAMIDDAFNLTNSNNSYIAMVWYEQAINYDYHGNNIDTKIEDFLIKVGRRWYVSTIYKAFKRNDKVETALAIYKKARSNYHSVTANTIDDMLGYKQD